MITLHPVILPVPEDKTHLTGREKVRFLSLHARKALAFSAGFSKIRLEDPVKDDDGVPLPSNGYYWSVTHKRLYVGGVVAPRRIGMDIEEIKPRSKSMFKKVAVDEEWGLSGAADPFHPFYRFWTAKEAVIKTLGSGLKDLLKIRVTQIPDEHHLILGFSNKPYLVEHYYFDRHIASIVKDGCRIEWKILSGTEA